MDRLSEIILNFLLDYGLYGPVPYALIFAVLFLCGLGLPVPEDITLFIGGVLAFYGVADPWIMIGVSLLGVLVGDALIFFLGRKYGMTLVRRWPFNRFLSPQAIHDVGAKFQKRGNKLLFAARFMPGLRAPIFFSAGVLKVSPAVFLAYDGFAALISVPAIVYSVYAFGEQLDKVVGIIQRVEHGILFVIFGAISLVVLKWYLSRRRRLSS